jgi:hypothetical protein
MAKANNRSGGIAAAVALLAEAFGRQATDVTFRAYIAGLEGLSVEQIEIGVNRALRTCKFMPTPAELREMSGELKGGDRAVKAWIVFEKAVTRIGSYKTVSFDDVVINAVVRSLGGWVHCCTMPTKEFDTFLRKKFTDAYEALYRAGVGEEEAAPLQGTFDRENCRLGYDPQRVLEVRTGLPPSPNAPRISLESKRHVSGLLTLKDGSL